MTHNDEHLELGPGVQPYAWAALSFAQAVTQLVGHPEERATLTTIRGNESDGPGRSLGVLVFVLPGLSEEGREAVIRDFVNALDVMTRDWT